LALSACEPGANLQPLEAPPANAPYQLSAGDQVRLITFDEQALSGQFTIDDSGNIALPLLGTLPADGLTTHQLADAISSALRSRKLLADPSVVVEVVKYRPIFVLGEVQHPGPYAYQPHTTLLSAVALAGGFTPRAVRDRAAVLRAGRTGSTEGTVGREGPIEPGDVVTIFERNF
jgi:polysaccharide export outer membrane protein